MYKCHMKNLISEPELIDPGQSRRLDARVSLLNKQMDSDEDRKHTSGQGKRPIKGPEASDSYLAAKRIRVDTDPGTADETKMASDSHPPETAEYAEPDLMYMKRDESPHKGVDAPIKEGTMEDELNETPSCGVPEKDEVERSSAIESVPDATAHSSVEVLLDKAISPALAQKINDDIKFQLMKEVRKLGRRYDAIFTLLEDVRGPLSVKKQFVELTIKEAARFKRQFLIKQLEAFLHKMVSYHGKRRNTKKNK
ncbi:integrator complex subunit 6-like [Sorex araneus]|uniref:integrator complex subunit 6-like n=1 Tax=Sorex araneus TaxID=42254 RepID=UPI002433E263|nr:integrator complex subunit 6-like [Sorex araneus]